MSETVQSTDRIEKSILLRAPLARVWRALTDHVEFGKWFHVEVDQPFMVGRSSRARILAPRFERLTMELLVTAIEPQHRFAYRWHPGRREPRGDEPRTLVEFRLQESAGGTRLDLVESGFDALPAELRAEVLRTNSDGWAIQIERIRAHVEA